MHAERDRRYENLAQRVEVIEGRTPAQLVEAILAALATAHLRGS